MSHSRLMSKQLGFRVRCVFFSLIKDEAYKSNESLFKNVFKEQRHQNGKLDRNTPWIVWLSTKHTHYLCHGYGNGNGQCDTEMPMRSNNTQILMKRLRQWSLISMFLSLFSVLNVHYILLLFLLLFMSLYPSVSIFAFTDLRFFLLLNLVSICCVFLRFLFQLSSWYVWYLHKIEHQ